MRARVSKLPRSARVSIPSNKVGSSQIRPALGLSASPIMMDALAADVVVDDARPATSGAG